MSQKRQPLIFDRLGQSESQIVTRTQDYPLGHIVAMHYHDRDQLVYASRGVMTVRTDHGSWVVPTHRAVWIPARVPHGIRMSGKVAMRTLYLRPQLARSLPRECCVVNVPPLLNELILHACDCGSLNKKISWQRHLMDVILDQLEALPTIPLQLPDVFSDPRARRLAEMLMADPGNRRPLAQVCKAAGAGKRTMERLFTKPSARHATSQHAPDCRRSFRQ